MDLGLTDRDQVSIMYPWNILADKERRTIMIARNIKHKYLIADSREDCPSGSYMPIIE